METNVLNERVRFVRDFASGHWSMTELCERFGVSRPTGYKWVARHRTGGDRGLQDRSRAPHHCPRRTDGELEALVVAARLQYGWGAKKLGQVLRIRHPDEEVRCRPTPDEDLTDELDLHRGFTRR